MTNFWCLAKDSLDNPFALLLTYFWPNGGVNAAAASRGGLGQRERESWRRRQWAYDGRLDDGRSRSLSLSDSLGKQLCGTI